MNILITGGAGYVGSAAAQLFIDQGHKVYVLDNLSSGFIDDVPIGAEFIYGDVLDSNILDRVFVSSNIDAVLHFAAKLIVPESVEAPNIYYENNVIGGLKLLQACIKYNVNKFIFSSTAAVYGNSSKTPILESSKIAPLNPYGWSKLMVEQFLKDFDNAFNLKYIVLRYFNVAGAFIDGTRGQRSKNATHLIKVASEVAVGKRDKISIFGTDYLTRDGTCIRDYIHVYDLAKAHVHALDYLNLEKKSTILNCGYGHGYSVREVLENMRHVSKNNFEVFEAPRRVGDADSLVADSSMLRKVLNWSPKYDNLETICRSAFEWEKKLI